MIKKLLLTGMLLIATVLPASAQPRKQLPLGYRVVRFIYVMTAASDAYYTVAAVENGSGHEANRFLVPIVEKWGIEGAMLTKTAGHYGIVRVWDSLAESHPKLATITMLGMTGVNLGASVNNAKIAHHKGQP